MHSRSMGRARWALIVALSPIAAACVPLRPHGAPVPDRARDLAIYRTVAESLYVRSTQGFPVAIVTSALDTTCAATPCAPLLSRWGLDSTWRDAADRTAMSETRDALLARAGRPLDLSAVALGHPKLIAVSADSAPPGAAPVDRWRSFRAEYDDAAGVLRFSPVGFTRDGRRALVFVQWECGPSCGHELVAALRQDERDWQVEDVLLIGPRRPASGAGTAP